MAYRHTGFTLIEMVMVLILIGVLAVVFVPRAPSKGSLTFAGQAQQLASDIRYVQTLSMTRGQRYCLNLTSAGYSMTISNCSTSVGVEHPAGATFPITLDGVTLSWTNLPGSLVTFTGKGEPYTDSAATTALAINAVITLNGDGGPGYVCVTPATGRVFVDTNTDCQ
jgi:prepilin-type N-terminal cleavage/methylation domain-containing protein